MAHPTTALSGKSSYFGSSGATCIAHVVISCQNRLCADQYHLTVQWAQVMTHQGRVFKLSARFHMITGSSSNF